MGLIIKGLLSKLARSDFLARSMPIDFFMRVLAVAWIGLVEANSSDGADDKDSNPRKAADG